MSEENNARTRRRRLQTEQGERRMTIFNLAGRAVGMVIGIIGAILALLVTFINFFVKNIQAGSLGNAHTPTGILMTILAFVGAIIALPFPIASAILMIIGGIGMIFVAGAFGALPLIVLVVAAIIVFLDRNKISARRV